MQEEIPGNFQPNVPEPNLICGSVRGRIIEPEAAMKMAKNLLMYMGLGSENKKTR